MTVHRPHDTSLMRLNCVLIHGLWFDLVTIFRAKKIPIIIRRYLPDGSYEDWSVDELIVE